MGYILGLACRLQLPIPGSVFCPRCQSRLGLGLIFNLSQLHIILICLLDMSQLHAYYYYISSLFPPSMLFLLLERRKSLLLKR